MKTSETKYKIGYSENVSLYHDRGTSSAGLLTSNQGAIVFNPWFSITKGDTVSQRDGDECYPRGMSFRLMFNGYTSQFVRVIVAVVPKIDSTTILDGSNYDLLDQSSSNDTVTGLMKREGVKVLYDRTITLQDHGKANDQKLLGDFRFFKKFFIKSKKGSKLAWGQDGLLVNKPVGIWVIPYNNYSTLRSADIGVVSFTYKMYFKDI